MTKEQRKVEEDAKLGVIDPFIEFQENKWERNPKLSVFNDDLDSDDSCFE